MKDNPAVDHLQKLFDEDPVEEGPIDEQEHDSADDVIGRALSVLPLDSLSSQAQELILAVTDSSTTLEPRTRRLLVEAGDRANRKRREDSSALPRLLFLIRNRENQSIEELAKSLGADNSLLQRIERGEEDIRELGAEGVASWISHFHVPADAAIEALRATFLIAKAVDRAAASAQPQLNDDQNRFVEEVGEALSR